MWFLVVHSSDAEGPQSLHPALPLRSGELLVRRGLIERGLYLMKSRNLVEITFLKTGIHFEATDQAEPFLSAVSSNYLMQLRLRADWAFGIFGDLTDDDFANRTSNLLRRWNTEFEGRQRPGEITL